MTGRPGLLQFMGLQRVRHDWATELTEWMGLIFLVSDSRAGLSNMWFLTAHSLGRISKPRFFCVPSDGLWVLNWSLLFLSYPILCVSFLQPWLYKSLSASLKVVFSKNRSTCRYVLMCIWGEVRLASFYSTIISVYSLNIISLKTFGNFSLVKQMWLVFLF